MANEMTATTTTPRVLGFNDEVTTCDVCGKAELKGTYAVDIDGEIVRMGSTCYGLRFHLSASRARTELAKAVAAILAAKRQSVVREVRATAEYAAVKAAYAAAQGLVGTAHRDAVSASEAAVRAVTMEISGRLGADIRYVA